jgi:hypothetical protein
MGVRMNLAKHAKTIALALLGEPNKTLSTKGQLRFGTNGSLAVAIAGPNAGTWFDHEHGNGGGMIDLIRRETGFSNGAAVEWLKDIGIDPGPPKQTTVAEYIYQDQAGEPVFKVIRKGPKKQFFQARYDASTGSFVSGKGCMDGVRRVPYRLNEWADAEGIILIPEGEKDVDRLRALKLISTCNAGGAGKWSRGYAPYFQDREVVILPDNDQVGRDHARDIASSLQPVASSVKILELPGLQDKGDVSDWLDAGHNADELRDLIQKAPDAAVVLAEWAAAPQEPPANEEWKNLLLEAVEELNGKHFVSSLSGQAVIASTERDDELGREHLVFSKPADIRLLYQSRHFVVGISQKGNEIWKDLGSAWIEHSKRREYPGGIRLIPKGPCPPGVYNLWRGFGAKPKKGTWDRIRVHLRDVICSGSEFHFDWLISWFAYCVQHPEKRAETAVVLRGKKGVGKGMVAQLLLRLFRDHGMHIANSKHLTGNFNAHLMDTLALFLDEALWAGDKVSEGVLKQLITEPTIPIEPKHVNAFQVTNRLKIIIASNNEWVVPVTADERRFFVLDVPETKKGDRKYFTALADALESELPPFLHHLLEVDLAEFDHRDPPHTDALNEQKLLGLDSVGRFWLDCLTNGEIPNVFVPEEANAGWPEDVVVSVLHGAYVEYAKARGERYLMSDNHMAARLAELMPDKVLRRYRPENKPYGGIARPRRYALQGLGECRTAFLTAMNIASYLWPAIDGT